jgi:rRNA maturation endonuclease Nob1
MTGYKVHKEYIWHFTCVSCNGYWSIATMDEWVPKTMFCPHCGKKQMNDSELIQHV